MTLQRGVLDIRVAHRFDNVNTGRHFLYGLDNLRDNRLALEYGISDRFSTGLGRSKGDFQNAPQQEVIHLYDLYFKYLLFTQDSPFIPVTVSLLANSAMTGMRSRPVPGREGHIENPADRFSFLILMLAARKLTDRLSLQIMACHLRRNWVAGEDEMDLLSAGTGGRILMSRKLSLLVEYYYTFSQFRNLQPDQYFDHLGMALEIFTGGHVFTINLTNSTGLIPNTYLPYTTSSWLRGEFRIGFEISRLLYLIR